MANSTVQHCSGLLRCQLGCCVQMDGFGSDSTRMITLLRKASPNLQLLLFSATFNERVKEFALRVAGPQANQVCFWWGLHC